MMIADFIQNGLTDSFTPTKLLTLHPHDAAGIITPVYPWRKDADQWRFFMPVILRMLKHAYSLWRVVLSQLWLGSSTGCGDNLIQFATKLLSPVSGGLSTLYRGVTVMLQNKSVKNSPTKAVSPICVFNAYFHRQQIALNIPGTKAEQIKRLNQAVIIKFSGFGGAL